MATPAKRDAIGSRREAEAAKPTVDARQPNTFHGVCGGRSGTTATLKDVSDEDVESNDSYRRFVSAGANVCVVTGAWLDLENNVILDDAPLEERSTLR